MDRELVISSFFSYVSSMASKLDTLKTMLRTMFTRYRGTPFIIASSQALVVYDPDKNLPATQPQPIDWVEVETDYFDSIKGGFGC